MLFSREYRKRTAFNACSCVHRDAVLCDLHFLPSTCRRGPVQGFGTELLLNLLLIAALSDWCTVKFSRRASYQLVIILAAACSYWRYCPGAGVVMVLTFGVCTLVLSAVSNLVGVFRPKASPRGASQRHAWPRP